MTKTELVECLSEYTEILDGDDIGKSLKRLVDVLKTESFTHVRALASDIALYRLERLMRDEKRLRCYYMISRKTVACPPQSN